MRRRNSNEEWDYISPPKRLCAHVLGEDERGEYLVPCVNWNKHHQCYEANFSERLNFYNRRNPFHWRFKAMSHMTNKVVWVEIYGRNRIGE